MTEPGLSIILNRCRICPPWILKCAHGDGWVLWLSDYESLRAADVLTGTHYHGAQGAPRFSIAAGTGVKPCTLCPSRHLILRDITYEFTSETGQLGRTEVVFREIEQKHRKFGLQAFAQHG